MLRQRPPPFIPLILAIILEPGLQLPPQPPLLLHHAPPLLQRLPPPLVHGVKARHGLALLVVEQVVIHASAGVDDGSVATPRRRHKQAVQGVGYFCAPGRWGEVGDIGGHGEVLAVTGAVTADEGQDQGGEEEVEDGGEEEGDEDGLGILV
jgi:hypothetical protein